MFTRQEAAGSWQLLSASCALPAAGQLRLSLPLDGAEAEGLLLNFLVAQDLRRIQEAFRREMTRRWLNAAGLAPGTLSAWWAHG